MRTITTEQNKMLHAILGSLGLLSDKAELVRQYTDGRTDSSRQMHWSEAESLIKFLKNSQQVDSHGGANNNNKGMKRVADNSLRKAIKAVAIEMLGMEKVITRADWDRVNEYIEAITGVDSYTLQYRCDAEQLKKALAQMKAAHEHNKQNDFGRYVKQTVKQILK